MDMNASSTAADPTLASFYQHEPYFLFPFEANFDYNYRHRWMSQNWKICFYFIGAYLLFIFLGQEFMKNRPKYELRGPLVIWNAGLAVFSILGFIRTAPECYYAYQQFGFRYSVCVASFMTENQVGSFWTWVFVASKVPEFGDTVFIVLRKQKLIFLHWYHHIIVVVYCWYTYQQHTSMVRWFITINFFVHGLMYSYFALRALRFKIPKMIAQTITTLQILQMIIACIISSVVYYYLNQGYFCDVEWGTAYFALVMYFSFFILFSNFFCQSYLMKAEEKTLANKKL